MNANETAHQQIMGLLGKALCLFELEMLQHIHFIEIVKIMSLENVNTGILGENKEHYLRCKDKAKQSHGALRHIQLHMSKY